jgi:hypothetical protein
MVDHMIVEAPLTNSGVSAQVHAELETAAQMERIADQLEQYGRTLHDIAELISETVDVAKRELPNFLGFVSQFVRPAFDPNQN